MAYQPKSYRKFLATSVTAALVATVAAPLIPSVSAASNTSFPDVASTHWASDAIAYLVDKGALEGRPNGKFDPNANVTRAEAAKILAITLGLEVDAKAKTDFSDAKDHWASSYIAAIQAQTEDVINGFPNGTFKPNANITRQDLAKMIVTAYDLEANEDSKVNFTDNTGYGAEFVKVLASLGIVEGMSEGKFVPQNNVTRAQIPVFVHRSEVPAVRVTPNTPAELAITNVTALDDTNRFLQIDFNKRVNSLETSDISIQDAKSLEKYGVKEVKLSSNGMTATVELFSHEGQANILQYLHDYTVTVKANGKILEYTFNRPAYTEARVVDINVQDNEIVVFDDNNGARRVLKVAKDTDFDYEAAFGEVGHVWYNADNELVQFKSGTSTSKYDAVEITKADEIKLVTEDVKYDTSDDQYRNTSKDKFKFFLNGKEVEIGDGVRVGDKFNFAKVGYDKSGDIEFIAAYNLSKFLVVDKVDNKEVVGIKGAGTGGSYDADKATIIKDGKVISLSDLKKGDILFYYENSDDKKQRFAEVFSGKTVSGEITTIFDDSIRVNGETHKFKYSSTATDYALNYGAAVYIDEDGETAILDADAAEELQAAGKVTLHFDRAGNLVYVGGALADVESNNKVAILTDAMVKGTSNFLDDLVKLETLNQDNVEKLYELRLKDLDAIIVDGTKYQIDNGSTSKWTVGINGSNIELKKPSQTTVTVPLSAVGSLVKVNLTDKGSVKEVEFFKNNVDPTLNKNLAVGDKYADGIKLNSNTPVFVATNNSNPYDAKNVKVTTWGEYKGSDIDAAHFVYNKDGEVVGLVVTSTATNSKVFEEAVVTKVLRNKDGDIVELTAYINGEKKTVEVDEVNVALAKGDVTVLEFDKANDKLVTDIENTTSDDSAEYTTRVSSGWTVDSVDAGTKKVTLKKSGSADRIVTLANQGLVINGADSDLPTKTITDLRGKTNVTIVADEKSSDFIKFFVYGAQPSNPTNPAVTEASMNVPSVVQPGNNVTVELPTNNTQTYLVKVTNLTDANKTAQFAITGTGGSVTSQQLISSTANATAGDALLFELRLGTDVISSKTVTFDNVAPTVTSAKFTSATNLEITFSEAVTAAAGDFSNEALSTGTVALGAVTGSGTNVINIAVTGTPAIVTTVTGTIDIANTVTDAAGNALVSVTGQTITSGF